LKCERLVGEKSSSYCEDEESTTEVSWPRDASCLLSVRSPSRSSLTPPLNLKAPLPDVICSLRRLKDERARRHIQAVGSVILDP
jgi:hypothetical protein